MSWLWHQTCGFLSPYPEPRLSRDSPGCPATQHLFSATTSGPCWELWPPKVPEGLYDSSHPQEPGRHVRTEVHGHSAYSACTEGKGNQKGEAPKGRWGLEPQGPRGQHFRPHPQGERAARASRGLRTHSLLIPALLGPDAPLRGRQDTAHPKPTSSLQVGGPQGHAVPQPPPPHPGHTDPLSPKGGAAADRLLRRVSAEAPG